MADDKNKLNYIGGLRHDLMQQLLGYNLAQASIPPFALYEKYIGAPLKLRQVDFAILVLLSSNEDVTQKMLSTALSIAPSNLTVIVDRNVKRELIQRRPSEEDRRSQYLQLTPAGRALVRKAWKIASSMEAELLSHFSTTERAVLFELLQRIAVLRGRGVQVGS
jgi:DNA-binding MarR family transcriptional regulator